MALDWRICGVMLCSAVSLRKRKILFVKKENVFFDTKKSHLYANDTEN